VNAPTSSVPPTVISLVPGLLCAYGAALDASAHAHNAVQVVWPAGRSRLDLGEEGQRVDGAGVVAPGVEHRLTMAEGWVLLVEPQSGLGARLLELLDDRPWLALDGFGPAPADEAAALAALRTYVGGVFEPAVDDPRINDLLRRLDACFAGTDCLKPDRWRAAEVAAGMGLSEGRFLHLFREQVGTAWRPYLLWRRLLCAVRAMVAGESATTAAHHAGFADSAHLSRTFRATFGLSIREATAVFGR